MRESSSCDRPSLKTASFAVSESRCDSESGEELRTEFLESRIKGIVLREQRVHLEDYLVLAWILQPRISSIRRHPAERGSVHV